MQTKLCAANEASIAQAARLIQAGEVVGFPTETVYGLGANALCGEAVRKIFAAKGRPADNPLIVHIADVDALDALVEQVPPAARALMDAYWPGPMTLLFPRKRCIPDVTTAGLDTVGIRLPSNPVARALIRKSGVPIAAPSANRSGRPSPTTAQRVLEDMDGIIPLILDGGPCEVGLESSFIDATGGVPVILRPGGITPEMIRAVCGDVRVDEHVMTPLKDGDIARSPGMKYKHYAPRAQVIIFEGAPETVRGAIAQRYDALEVQGKSTAIFAASEHRYGKRRVYAWGSQAHPEQAAAVLFEALRSLDDQGMDTILCEALDETGIGLAVMNRMGRAAGFHIERV